MPSSALHSFSEMRWIRASLAEGLFQTGDRCASVGVVRYLSGVESQPIIRGEASVSGRSSMHTSTLMDTSSSMSWCVQEALDSFGGGLGNILGGTCVLWAMAATGRWLCRSVLSLYDESKELASGVLAASGRWEAWSPCSGDSATPDDPSSSGGTAAKGGAFGGGASRCFCLQPPLKPLRTSCSRSCVSVNVETVPQHYEYGIHQRPRELFSGRDAPER